MFSTRDLQNEQRGLAIVVLRKVRKNQCGPLGVSDRPEHTYLKSTNFSSGYYNSFHTSSILGGSYTFLTFTLVFSQISQKRITLGWFLHVSLILIIKGRYSREVSLIVIIKEVSAWLSLIIKHFHHFSPNLSKSDHDSPDQTDDRIKLSCQRRWNSFWRSGHRWWRSSINISI